MLLTSVASTTQCVCVDRFDFFFQLRSRSRSKENELFAELPSKKREKRKTYSALRDYRASLDSQAPCEKGISHGDPACEGGSYSPDEHSGENDDDTCHSRSTLRVCC